VSNVLRIYPDAVLHERAKEVENFQGIGELTEQMLKIMVENDGIGLAANQIGIANQIFVVMLDEEDESLRIVNPMIVDAGGEDVMEEGCLSIPNTSVEIIRSEYLILKGFDPDGREVEYKLEGLKARVAQHEIDHLNGILIIDYIPRREKLRFQREYEKRKKEIDHRL
jgi:peptide deformylase